MRFTIIYLIPFLFFKSNVIIDLSDNEQMYRVKYSVTLDYNYKKGDSISDKQKKYMIVRNHP